MSGTGGCLLLALMLLCWPTCAESSSGQHGLRGADASDSNPRPDGGAPPRRRHRLQHRSGGEVHVEHAAVAARHLVTMFLALDVRSLNTALLGWFRGGVAAALGVPVDLVHINAVDEEKNGVELFVSSERPDAPEPRPARDVVRSLDARVLHRHLAHFGITEVSSEKNVLEGAPREHAQSQECFSAGILIFAIFIMAFVSLTLFYRLKATLKSQPKAPPPHFTTQARPRGRPIAGARPLPAPAPPPPPQPSPAPSSEVDLTPSMSVAPVTNEPEPCVSPFRMKAASRLQERRGSNVALVLDTSAPGSGAAATPPGEEAAREYLVAAGRALTPQRLRALVKDVRTLHAEFSEIPMNFTDPKRVDVPNHGSKNRYETILPRDGNVCIKMSCACLMPDPHSRVVLRSPLSTYINANYIRGYLGDERAFIATQGPLANTVDDFWLMAWQEAAPAIVMITKLKEKNEKCALYWPERSGVYGDVHVEVNGVRECRHYTARRITLKHGPRTHALLHYWFTSWPDHKTPDAASPLLRLMDDVEEARRGAAPGPVIVHCSSVTCLASKALKLFGFDSTLAFFFSAGIGRTGCFIAASVGARQLAAEGAVDVLAITCRLRLDRGGMIQTAEQYHFVHRALSLYERRRGDLTCGGGAC
ncbi:tyrosine-protein phosphatase non-receptor type 5 isoform X3 [Syngnathoides biaculeatus]|uniref:tyrosine-protein phosphatase non-receptor type 5 isoform X3 n=1 Tax=Syngnathoides biaculeatus TaxID=300417 RepID=UPI002ADE489A|nr:tyrosine-protein phosphatase non-receptor type 5 isoform X3 [Syngnathoides biaculeatus]